MAPPQHEAQRVGLRELHTDVTSKADTEADHDASQESGHDLQLADAGMKADRERPCEPELPAVQETLEDLTAQQLAAAVAYNRAMGLPEFMLRQLQDTLDAKVAVNQPKGAVAASPQAVAARRRGPLATLAELTTVQAS